MKSFYATITDINYLVRALALYYSFEPYLGPNRKFALFCVDEQSFELSMRMGLSRCLVLSIDDFETDEIRSIKNTRSAKEYTWTFKPVALRHVLKLDPELDWVVYLDADMMVFGDPDTALRTENQANCLLTPHASTAQGFIEEEKIAGEKNAGYVAFRNSQEGIRALGWWHDRCLELCPSVPTNGIYADQTYLNEIGHQFEAMVSSTHRGLNAGPWNVTGGEITIADGRIYLAMDELLIYHFQGLRIYGSGLFDLYPGDLKISAIISDYIYRPYLRELSKTIERIRTLAPAFCFGIEPLATRPKLVVNKLKRWVIGVNNMATTW